MALQGTGPALLNGHHIHFPRTTAARHVTVLDRWIAARIQRLIDGQRVRLCLWDGSSPASGSQRFIGSIVVRDRGALLGLAINPDLYFGEAYMSGRVDVEGPFAAVVEALTRVSSVGSSWLDWARAAVALPNTVARARHNIHHHYDLGNDFYQQWLDAELLYTCAYFPSPEASLEAAQQMKMEVVCRKLRLRPGETVVEAGCGWGALALYMARHYGVTVKAFNISREQITYARDRARREGISDRVEFIDDDYRNIKGEFDAFVSVGMLEHVGPRQFGAFAGAVRRSVRRAGGRGLLHFIGRDVPRPLNAWIRRRIFPGAYPPTLAEVARDVLVPAGMSVLDVENLRLHYAKTLEHWRRRFEGAVEHVRSQYGEPFARAWHLYLAGSQASFASGWLQLYQVVFAPAESAPPYWVRADAEAAGPCFAVMR